VDRHSGFKEWSGLRNHILPSFYYDVAHDQSWPLRQDQGSLADLRLARGGFCRFAYLGKRLVEVISLLFRLPSHFAERSVSCQSGPESQPCEHPVGQRFPEPIVPALRIVAGVLALGCGSRLAWRAGYEGRGWGWHILSIVVIFAGLGLLIVPVGW